MKLGREPRSLDLRCIAAKLIGAVSRRNAGTLSRVGGSWG